MSSSADMSKIISLYGMPYEVMLILRHASGVIYENQVGGVICHQASEEGVLSPLDLEPDDVEKIMNLPWEPRRGIHAGLADAVDAVLAASSGGRYVTVDRARLADSWEAWVYVLADIPESSERVYQGPYFGSPRGFGPSTGILTWINSD